jgi:hypothetical protein
MTVRTSDEEALVLGRRALHSDALTPELERLDVVSRDANGHLALLPRWSAR